MGLLEKRSKSTCMGIRPSVLLSLLAALALQVFATCGAATLDECLQPLPKFSGDARQPDVAVIGVPGSKAILHPVHPALCRSPEAGLCASKVYVIPGDHVDATRRCGSWVYVRYTGKRTASYGWIRADQLVKDLPDSETSQSPVDGTKVPQCDHSHNWATHDGRFVASAGQTITVRSRNPLLCSEPNAGLCGITVKVRAGATTYYSDVCGSLVYVSPRDEKLSEWTAVGWVDSRNVTPLTTSTHGFSTQPAPDLPFSADPLYDAVIANDLDKVRAIVVSGRNLNVPIVGSPRAAATGSFSILSTAIRQGHPEMVRLLLSLGADPNLRNPNLAVGCALASAAESPDVAAALLQGGADPNCRSDAAPGLPLKWAAGNVRPADVTFLKILIAAHADVNIDNGAPLKQAIYINNVEGAALLLAAGADPNLGTPVPLMSAIGAYQGNLDPTMTRMLLKAGANPNYREPGQGFISPRTGELIPAETVLTKAAETGYLELVRLLLEGGSNPRQTREGGSLPDVVALQSGHRDVAALIEQYAVR